MKPLNSRIRIFKSRPGAGLGFALAAVLLAPPAHAGDTSVQTNQTFIAPRSVFLQPSNPREGRDPFFPGSLRPYAAAVVTSAPTTDLTSLAMQGTSGSPEHRLVIINNVTFAVGDDAEVVTAQGRIRLHCIAINDDSAVIEAAGQRQILRYKSKP